MITRISVLLVCTALFAGCGGGNSPDHVIIATRAGDIEVQLFPDKAPQTVQAFLKYADAGLYQNASFYRVLSQDNQPTGANAAELIQGGVYKKVGNRDSFPGIPHEPTSLTGLSHTHGTLSMARQEPGTATTEFFICIGDNPGFDAGGNSNPDLQGYAAFGRVIRGMDVVMRIYQRDETNQEFTPPVGIINISRK